MQIIAERINATRSSIAKAIEDRDADHIAEETRKQDEAGAHWIDVNAGSDPDKELENLKWLVGVVQDNTDLPLCVDSSTANVFETILPLLENDDTMINSVNGEDEKIENILPVAAEHNTRLVALTMGKGGLPKSVDERLSIVEKILDAAADKGLDADHVYFDPCIQPVSTSQDQARQVVESVQAIKEKFPEAKTTCGLSNVSYGLPYRNVLNRTFLSFLLQAGLDSAIIDPTEPDMVATVLAAEVLSGNDQMCMNYITAQREGKLNPVTQGAADDSEDACC